MLTMSLHCKETNSPTPWNSKLPKKYKCNVIIGDLDQNEKVNTAFTKEKFIIKSQFKKENFPTTSIDSVIKRFE